jgi:hypothetical protein
MAQPDAMTGRGPFDREARLQLPPVESEIACDRVQALALGLD